MQFLKTLSGLRSRCSWRSLASRNWHDVTLDLWGDIQVDIKVPVLLILVFLIGFLPPFLILRARLWQLRRRLESLERAQPRRHRSRPRRHVESDDASPS